MSSREAGGVRGERGRALGRAVSSELEGARGGFGRGRGEGVARGRRRDGDAVTVGNREGRWSEGNFVIKMKFQNSNL